jgi:hypothetical protein
VKEQTRQQQLDDFEAGILPTEEAEILTRLNINANDFGYIAMDLGYGDEEVERMASQLRREFVALVAQLKELYPDHPEIAYFKKHYPSLFVVGDELQEGDSETLR